MGLGFWATNWLASWSQSSVFWLNGLVLAFFSAIILYFLFHRQVSNPKDFLPIIVLPVFLSIGFSWFTPLLSPTFGWQLIATAILIISFYLVLLTENLFIFSKHYKAVPLYRTAFVTGFAFSLLICLLLLGALFSLEYYPWANAALVSLIYFLLFYHLFWSVVITESQKANLWLYSLIPALISGQLALILSFWPLSATLKAIYLVSWFYVFGGVFQSHLRERLFPKILREYIFIGMASLLALIFSSS